MRADDITMTGLPSKIYSEADHEVWRQLYALQFRLAQRYASRDYLVGLDLLALPSDRVADLDSINSYLRRWSDWRFVPATTSLPPGTFFRCLRQRQFPVRTTMRRAHELDFAEQPDLFHGLFGHGPHLFSPVLAPIVDEFGRTALRHADDSELLAQLSTLFWISFGVGVVSEGGELKAYGGAILSSRREMVNVFDRYAPIIPLAAYELTATAHEPRALQRHCVLIDSYAEIVARLEQLSETRSRNRTSRLVGP